MHTSTQSTHVYIVQRWQIAFERKKKRKKMLDAISLCSNTCFVHPWVVHIVRSISTHRTHTHTTQDYIFFCIKIGICIPFRIHCIWLFINVIHMCNKQMYMQIAHTYAVQYLCTLHTVQFELIRCCNALQKTHNLWINLWLKW